MKFQEPVERLVNLLDPEANQIFNMSVEDACSVVQSGNVAEIRKIEGHFALLAKEGQLIRMARSLGRPMRYFLAKRTEGPCLIVAERIDQIAEFLESEGLDGQFHPSYTRMVPAHHLLELKLIGCPDPNPVTRRFFSPKQNTLPSNLDEIGAAYIGALETECERFLDFVGSQEPLGVLFSGGIDSGAVFLVLYNLLLKRGESPSHLKAFTLSIDGSGSDEVQSRDFLKQLDLELFLEPVPVTAQTIDFREGIRVMEDYKPLDTQVATLAVALCREIREKYPDWKWLIDGDGGDENLKDYPIEENPELTIRSVLNNVMLYQEGWGVDAVKHSLTYSGGQSRGHVRSWAPGRMFGFHDFSPFALPNVIEVAEGIPFIELTDWDHEKLYNLKGEIVSRGVKAVTGFDMPIYRKRRFQHGVTPAGEFENFFPQDERVYRESFHSLYR
ncbi:Asparagine synthase [Thalassoglobus neptunius]|uniref:Asparagine synthase n=1 Tax=Thalassoglobus neptunius TaxID=1938619 RepID=A0A5C5WAM7_9PLAN|nr:asparagine synthase-related protein [Thalassoglobus neptunius]TWT47908.1 Asparagine synthase [Thalassoglobus neptunius]